MQIFTPKDPEYTTLQGEHFDSGLLAVICLERGDTSRCELITNYGYIIRLADGRIADVHILNGPAEVYGVRYWTDIDRIIARVVRYAVNVTKRELSDTREALADSASSNLSLRAANKRLKAMLYKVLDVEAAPLGD